jgi:hypothetical protein
MLVLVACVIAVASPLLAGRWPAGLVLHRWRWSWLIWASVLIQLAIITVASSWSVAPVLHVITYAAAIAFLWRNRAVPGALIVGLGALLNGVTIALNGGVLPARAGAVAAAGLDHGDQFANSAVLDDPVLPWLGDVFAWPEPLPLANTFSVGDVVLVIGVGVAAWAGSQRIGQPLPAPASAVDA